MSVEPFDFERVVEEIAADFGGVGQTAGETNVGETLVRAESGACFVGAMRLVAAIPETEGLSGGAAGEEVGEIARVVDVVDAFGGRGAGALVVLGAGGIAGAA